MTHEMIREKLTDFFDRELEESERAEIQTHLVSCEECRKTVDEWALLRAAFTAGGKVEASEVFVTGVMSHLEALNEPDIQEEAPAFILPQWLLPAFGYMAVIILMFVAIADRFPLISEEEVLRADLPQSAQWAVAAEPPDASKLLGM